MTSGNSPDRKFIVTGVKGKTQFFKANSVEDVHFAVLYENLDLQNTDWVRK